MRGNDILKAGAAALALLIAGLGLGQPVFSQEQAAAADAVRRPMPRRLRIR